MQTDQKIEDENHIQGKKVNCGEFETGLTNNCNIA
jgi:hypothetical protein